MSVRKQTPVLFLLLVAALWGALACGSRETKESCLRNDECKQKGLCAVNARGECYANDDSICKQSRFCRYVGECTLSEEEGRCIAKTLDDCRNSTACKDSKRCVPSGGECIQINPGFCRISSARCSTHGECSLDSIRNVCIARTDNDCASSQACTMLGRCSVDTATNTCVTRIAADCARSEGCANDGKCHLGGSESARTCVVLSHQDCLASKGCKEVKDKTTSRCAFDEARSRTCVNGDTLCQSLEGCSNEGKCTWSTEKLACIISSDDDCKSSLLCSLAKRCTFLTSPTDVALNRCVSADLDACQTKTECINDGKCKTQGGNCVADKDADCAVSVNCRLEGRCKLDAGACVIDNCDGAICDVYGRCIKEGADENATCAATSDEDCRTSEECRTKGLCQRDGDTKRCVQGGVPEP